VFRKLRSQTRHAALTAGPAGQVHGRAGVQPGQGRFAAAINHSITSKSGSRLIVSRTAPPRHSASKAPPAHAPEVGPAPPSLPPMPLSPVGVVDVLVALQQVMVVHMVVLSNLQGPGGHQHLAAGRSAHSRRRVPCTTAAKVAEAAVEACAARHCNIQQLPGPRTGEGVTHVAQALALLHLVLAAHVAACRRRRRRRRRVPGQLGGNEPLIGHSYRRSRLFA
jgi:hypothetical protein